MCVYAFTDADSIKEPKKNLMLRVKSMRLDFQMEQEKEVPVFHRLSQMFNRRTGSCTVDMWSGRNF